MRWRPRRFGARMSSSATSATRGSSRARADGHAPAATTTSVVSVGANGINTEIGAAIGFSRSASRRHPRPRLCLSTRSAPLRRVSLPHPPALLVKCCGPGPRRLLRSTAMLPRPCPFHRMHRRRGGPTPPHMVRTRSVPLRRVSLPHPPAALLVKCWGPGPRRLLRSTALLLPRPCPFRPMHRRRGGPTPPHSRRRIRRSSTSRPHTSHPHTSRPHTSRPHT